MVHIPMGSVQRRLTQSSSGIRQRQYELREQQQRFIEDESRAKAEITEGEKAYVLFPYNLYSLLKKMRTLD
jgi:hypothetical protein